MSFLLYSELVSLCYLFHLKMMIFFFPDRLGVLEKTDPGDNKPTYFKVWPYLLKFYYQLCLSLKRMWNIFLPFRYCARKFVYVVVSSIVFETVFS